MAKQVDRTSTADWEEESRTKITGVNVEQGLTNQTFKQFRLVKIQRERSILCPPFVTDNPFFPRSLFLFVCSEIHARWIFHNPFLWVFIHFLCFLSRDVTGNFQNSKYQSFKYSKIIYNTSSALSITSLSILSKRHSSTFGVITNTMETWWSWKFEIYKNQDIRDISKI